MSKYAYIDKQIWEFDVDDTLVMWDRSAYPADVERVFVPTVKGPAELVVNRFNVNMLIKLAKIGYYIRVHSGSGPEWALSVCLSLGITQYVDSLEWKPKGKTDDKGPGDGTTYFAYRDPKTGREP